MVPLGPTARRWSHLLVGLVTAGCAAPTADLEATRHQAICALAKVDARLDLLPAGPGAVGARLVTLDRDHALAAVRQLDDVQPSGLAKVRIDPPRPLLAVVLMLTTTDDITRAGLAHLRYPITLAMTRDVEDLEELEDGLLGRGHSLLLTDPQRAGDLPPELETTPGVDLRDARDLEAALEQSLLIAEQAGASWLFAPLTRDTLVALNRVLRDHPEAVHLVGIERVTRPPSPPAWRRRCDKSP